MDHLKFETPDLVSGNIDKIAQLFPSAITEVRGEDGTLKKGVNFEILRQLLSPGVVDGEEHYEFTWVGKKAAMAEAARPTTKTLRPVKEDSRDWDTTENLYIEGDNLEVLKILQESYLGKVKMIYIDPPYNTGKDFVYRDRFAESKEDNDKKAGVYDENGNRLFENTESNGRFHSDWCSMIYPRLVFARNLLDAKGAIFISIDDNEITNMRKCCDEVFGASNFVVQIIWKKRSTPPNDQVIGAAHEYILCYAKDIESLSLNLRTRSAEQLARYKNPDNHPKGPWVAGDLSANVKGGRYVASLNYPIKNPNTGEDHYPPNNGNWRYSKETIERMLKNDEIYFGEDGKGRPKVKRFLSEIKNGITYTSLWDFVPLNTQGSTEMTDLLGNLTIFDNPKPVGLLLELLRLGSGQDCTVLDFFSGSATTAHAVMQLNAEDGGHRKFIMVQLPEPCDEKSEACKAGYKNICEIGKERIRRAGDKLRAEHPDAHLDTGFRVFRVDSSNMKDVYYQPEELEQQSLLDMVSNIKEDRTDLDLLYACLLDWGVEIHLPHTSTDLDGCTVHNVDNGALVACFSPNVPRSVVEYMAKQQPLRAVFRDSAFASDDAKINVTEIFKNLSPDTKVRVI